MIVIALPAITIMTAACFYVQSIYGQEKDPAYGSVFVPPYNAGEEPARTKEDDRVILTLAIARWHGLTRRQAILLLAIYDHELAPRNQMKTCSYFGVRRSMRPELKFCRTFEDEYETTARICAVAIKRWCPNTRPETIKRFNHGFGKGRNRYPGYAEDPKWWKKVIVRMKQHEDIFY